MVKRRYLSLFGRFAVEVTMVVLVLPDLSLGFPIHVYLLVSCKPYVVKIKVEAVTE